MLKIFSTGELASGEICTKSSPASCAACKASFLDITPNCLPVSSITRSCGARICSFRRVYLLIEVLLTHFGRIVTGERIEVNELMRLIDTFVKIWE